jgi:hypothetical protein
MALFTMPARPAYQGTRVAVAGVRGSGGSGSRAPTTVAPPAPPPRPAIPPAIQRMRRGGKPARGMRGMGDVGAFNLGRFLTGGAPRYDALVIGTPAGISQADLWRQGMAGMGAAPGNAIDTLTGGQLSKMGTQLRALEMGLKLAIGAGVFAGVSSLLLLMQKGKRP